MADGLVILMLCCNDHRNGVFRGRCDRICLGAYLILESPYADRSLKCAISRNNLRLGKNHWWPHQGEIPWYGNWCYEGLRVTLAVAAEVLNFAVASGYRPEAAGELLWGKIESGVEIVAADLLET